MLRDSDGKNRAASKRDCILLVIIVLYLVFTFVRRLFPAAEMARPTQSALIIVIELVLGVGLIGLGVRILKGIPQGVSGRGMWAFLLTAGLVSFFGIFGIHLTGGQRVKSLQSTRPGSVLTDASIEALGAEMETMSSRMRELVASVEKAQVEVDDTRWDRTQRATPNQLRNLAREDLREHLAKQRAFLDSIDRVLQYLAESGFQEKSDRLFSYAESQRLTAGRQRPDSRSWRILRQLHGANHDMEKIVEEHWEEWRLLESPPPEAELKPWQKEVRRLASEATSAQKQLSELPKTASKATPPKEAKNN